MKQHRTIGIILFRRDKEKIRYLLLHHGGTYWNFPKGRQEAGEDDRQTAIRELAEETGITGVNFIDGFFDGYDYHFAGNPAYGEVGTIRKKAKFFLAQTNQTEVVISDEHIGSGWFGYTEALKRLHFENGKTLLKRAHQFLLKQ